MNRRVDLETIAHATKIVAILMSVTLTLVLLYDTVTIPETIDRKRVIGLAVGAVAALALAVYLILNPPE